MTGGDWRGHILTRDIHAETHWYLKNISTSA